MTTDPIIIRSKTRKRSVALSVEPDGSLRVLAPERTSLKWIKAFIDQKEGWIRRRRKELTIQEQRRPAPLKEGSFISFYGQKLRLVLTNQEEGIEGDTLKLRVSAPPTSETFSEEIKMALRLWAKQQARRLLPERVQYWAKQTGLSPTRVIITAPQKRWGSCTAKDEIRLNWQLIMASPEVADYVIVHELAHIRHKHHGPAFWRRVEKILPDYKKRQKELKVWAQNDVLSSCA